MSNAWSILDKNEYRGHWAHFYAAFHFRASYYSDGWPGFVPPEPSITFDLSQIEEGPALASSVDALNAEALRCFVTALPESERLLALDWQHESFWFKPSEAALAPTPGWQISVYPDGDYYSFVTQDMSQGTFGHPWEKTLCVFGPDLVSTLGATLATWLPVLRRSGG
ncbi:DUF2716 domain-containing protein [Nocardioides sp. GXZ039]|uniref:DUF2716 domain-containing protein n=1 Tax=Nocardioides sp. GXZ039 TaxID=3136018 RepID=UPI0030F3F170